MSTLNNFEHHVYNKYGIEIDNTVHYNYTKKIINYDTCSLTEILHLKKNIRYN